MTNALLLGAVLSHGDLGLALSIAIICPSIFNTVSIGIGNLCIQNAGPVLASRLRKVWILPVSLAKGREVQGPPLPVCQLSSLPSIGMRWPQEAQTLQGALGRPCASEDSLPSAFGADQEGGPWSGR